MTTAPFDFFTEYCRIHRAVYGRDPCTREQWAEWCVQSHRPEPRTSDAQWDHDREQEGNAQ
jgi:hypothetical protein